MLRARRARSYRILHSFCMQAASPLSLQRLILFSTRNHNLQHVHCRTAHHLVVRAGPAEAAGGAAGAVHEARVHAALAAHRPAVAAQLHSKQSACHSVNDVFSCALQSNSCLMGGRLALPQPSQGRGTAHEALLR